MEKCLDFNKLLVTPCHTGRFSQVFLLFLSGGCQEHELHLTVAPSHLPKYREPEQIHIYRALFSFSSVT